MRVGTIDSTNGNVLLKVPTSKTGGLGLDLIPNGKISADSSSATVDLEVTGAKDRVFRQGLAMPLCYAQSRQ